MRYADAALQSARLVIVSQGPFSPSTLPVSTFTYVCVRGPKPTLTAPAEHGCAGATLPKPKTARSSSLKAGEDARRDRF